MYSFPAIFANGLAPVPVLRRCYEAADITVATGPIGPQARVIPSVATRGARVLFIDIHHDSHHGWPGRDTMTALCTAHPRS